MSEIKILIDSEEWNKLEDTKKIEYLKEAASDAPDGSTVHVAWIEREE